MIRDVFNEDFASLVVAGEPAWSQVSGYVSSVAPDLADRVTKWTGEQDLFTHYRVDEQIAKAMDRKVWLPSGGSLVIDRTEAMTVVDVNTGKFVGSGGNLEETVTKNNIEAAEEVVRQLRLRDIGGIIVIDFIDMVLESNRDLVVRRLLECLGRDRTKHQVAEVTSLGLVQMTRKRVGSGLIEVFSEHVRALQRPRLHHPRRPGRPTRATAAAAATTATAAATTQPWRRQRQPRWRQRLPGDGGRGSRSRRGRGGRDQGGPAAGRAGRRPRPSGPTPAQIAAAAHQAALLASQAVAVDEAPESRTSSPPPAPSCRTSRRPRCVDAVESQQPAAVQPPETAPQVQDSVEAEQEQPAQAEAPAQQDAVAGPAAGRTGRRGALRRAATEPATAAGSRGGGARCRRRPRHSRRRAAVASAPASSRRPVPPAARPPPRSASLLSRAPTT